ncbi:hypothetical protein EGT74_06815 [Chitinophaga lutea]|uniref:Uncharacterized protein n=1 Tax=Chitinophaga lutea TaxID=2488634 RepID=A0A3N4Q0V9_9BACT|nr:oligosaccharide flippase family protein [Chitinophaga lutea]RPE13235.1 hypothetical protein EGT74_06815 [Chitinophaga lutea]
MGSSSAVGRNLKTLTSDSVIYGLANVVTKFAGFFLIPIYARYFTPAEYGVINLINATFLLTSIFLVFSLDSASARWFYDSANPNNQKQAFAGWFWFQTVVALIVMSIFLATSTKVSQLLTGDTDNKINIIIPSIGLTCNILPNIATNWLRVQRKAKTTTIFSCSLGITTVLLSMLLVVYFKMGITGTLAGVVITNIIFSIIAAIIVKDVISIRYFKLMVLKNMLRFAMPLVPASIAFWCITSSASYFLNFYTNKSTVGLYNMGVNIASGVAIFTGAFQQAWGPFAYSIVNQPDAKNTYANAGILYTTIMSVLGLLVILFSPEIILIFTTPAYLPATWVAGILSFNVIFIGLSYVATLGITIVKTTYPYAIAVISGAITTLLLFLTLIPNFGIQGAATAVLVGQALVTSYLFYKSQKAYFIPYNFFNIYMTISLSISIGICSQYFIQEVNTISFIFKVITVILYLGLIFILNRRIILQLIAKFNLSK